MGLDFNVFPREVGSHEDELGAFLGGGLGRLVIPACSGLEGFLMTG